MYTSNPVLLILFSTIISYILNLFGRSFFVGVIWKIYTSLPTPISRKLKEQKNLKLEVLRLRNEIQVTSAQDEFAKWAKSKRRHDQKLGKLEALNREINTSRIKFITMAQLALWLFTHGAKIVVSLYYLKTPMFYLPAGLVPGYIEFLVAFPKAPKGSVSAQIWVWACGVVVDLVVGVAILEGGRRFLDKIGRKKVVAEKS